MDKTGRAPGNPMEPELQEFHTGAAVHAYRTFGCHALPGAAGHRFAVWAPHAQRVALVGDFNGWDAAATPMDRLPDGTWVQTVDGLRDGALYKYAVTGPDASDVENVGIGRTSVATVGRSSRVMKRRSALTTGLTSRTTPSIAFLMIGLAMLAAWAISTS